MKAMPAKGKQALKTPAKTSKAATKSPAAPTKAAPTKAAPAKAAPKAAPVKLPAKSAVKKPVTRPVAKPASTPSADAARKGPAKPLASSAVKPQAPKPAAPKVPTPSPHPIAKPMAVTKAAQASPAPRPDTRVMPPTTVMSASGVPQRSGRPSSRLVSLTVPSMAQSVASTAAKASYAPLPVTPLIIPPLASAARKDPRLANNWKTKPVEQLTDPELLAMPDAEYMNEKQLAAFRLKLTLLKREILASAGETTEHLREDTVVVPDPADRATIEEEHALELRTRDRERKLLKKIEQAIARIDSGDYGYCEETGEPIGVGRLMARPTASLSLEAQQRRELKQKMFGD